MRGSGRKSAPMPLMPVSPRFRTRATSGWPGETRRSVRSPGSVVPGCPPAAGACVRQTPACPGSRGRPGRAGEAFDRPGLFDTQFQRRRAQLAELPDGGQQAASFEPGGSLPAYLQQDPLDDFVVADPLQAIQLAGIQFKHRRSAPFPGHRRDSRPAGTCQRSSGAITCVHCRAVMTCSSARRTSGL